MKKIVFLISALLLLIVAAFAMRGGIDYRQVRQDVNLQSVKETFNNIPASATSNIGTITYPSRNMVVSPNVEGLLTPGPEVSLTQPPFPMTITLFVSQNVGGAAGNRVRGKITLSGIDARGNNILEEVNMPSQNSKLQKETKLAFARIDAIGFDAIWVTSNTNAVSLNVLGIGTGGKVGLSNPINNWDNVYKISYSALAGGISTTLSVTLPADVRVTSINVNPSGNFYGAYPGVALPISVFVPANVSTTSTSYIYDVWYRQGD